MGTLTLSIDAPGGAVLLSGSEDGTTWGIVSETYQGPSRQPRIQYADGAWMHGSVALGFTWQQSLMSFDVAPKVASEAALRTAIASLQAALSQLNYETTETINGVADVWTCDPGTLAPTGRSLTDLDTFDPVFTVTIPCYPVAS